MRVLGLMITDVLLGQNAERWSATENEITDVLSAWLVSSRHVLRVYESPVPRM